MTSTTPGIIHKTIALPGKNAPAFRMIKVESGTFWMGGGKYDREKPLHRVRLSGFYMAEFPVTQDLWHAVRGDRPAGFQGKRRPVESVSWEEAVQFCHALSELTGLPHAYDARGHYRDARGVPTDDITQVEGFRLPTEAEWEYAAIGGHLAPKKEGIHHAAFPYAGSNRLEEVGWYRENSRAETKDVGLKLPNRLGLHDMSGNVWEWCGDWYDGEYYSQCHEKGVVHNPIGPAEGSNRVYRGGSWFNYAVGCRVSSRNRWLFGGRDNYVGFRLVLSPRSLS